VRAALVLTYVAAAGLGYVLGVRGVLPYGPLKASTSTPLARLGVAFRDGTSKAYAASLTLLRGDVDTVRARLGAPERDAFDLVVALRGLRDGGKTDVAGAARSCQALKLARCDERALEVLQKRSAP
jgi:hypothetical protein